MADPTEDDVATLLDETAVALRKIIGQPDDLENYLFQKFSNLYNQVDGLFGTDSPITLHVAYAYNDYYIPFDSFMDRHNVHEMINNLNELENCLKELRTARALLIPLMGPIFQGYTPEILYEQLKHDSTSKHSMFTSSLNQAGIVFMTINSIIDKLTACREIIFRLSDKVTGYEPQSSKISNGVINNQIIQPKMLNVKVVMDVGSIIGRRVY